MDRAAVLKAISALGEAENRNGDEQINAIFLFQLLRTMESPNALDTRAYLKALLARLKNGKPIPVEIQIYMLERYLLAAEEADKTTNRKGRIPQVLGLSVLECKEEQNISLIMGICSKAYDFRRNAKPADAAIKWLYSEGELSSESYAEKLYRKHNQESWLRLILLGPKKARLKFYISQLKPPYDTIGGIL